MKRPAWPNITVELLVALVCVVFCILVIRGSGYRESLLHAREAVWKRDVATMPEAIEKYTLDMERPPQSLQNLVDGHYLPRVHRSFNGKKRLGATLWQCQGGSGKTVFGIDDVHSSTNETNTEGTPYNDQ